jgi:hypothetical protein
LLRCYTVYRPIIFNRAFYIDTKNAFCGAASKYTDLLMLKGYMIQSAVDGQRGVFREGINREIGFAAMQGGA